MKGLLMWQVWFGVAALGTMIARGDTPSAHWSPATQRSQTFVALSVREALSVGEEVSFQAPSDGVRIAGTLTRPTRGGPHPAVLLLSGAGPHDRDGAIAGHRPFEVLAAHLTRAGFAVLRLDDRGVAGSAGDSFETTIPMRVSDAMAALAMLRTRSEVDASHMGLIGHSEGATVAATVAAETSLDFVVSLAGPGVSGRDLSPQQVASVLQATGAYPEQTVSALVDAQRHIVDVIANDGDRVAVTKAVHAGLLTLDSLQPPAHRRAPERLAEQAARDGAVVAAPWFRSFVKTDPGEAWRRVRCPVLALNGTLDVQVAFDSNLRAIGRALHGNGDVQTRRLEGLNHLLQRAQTGLASEYAQLDEAIDPEVVALVVAFAAQRAGRVAP